MTPSLPPRGRYVVVAFRGVVFFMLAALSLVDASARNGWGAGASAVLAGFPLISGIERTPCFYPFKVL